MGRIREYLKGDKVLLKIFLVYFFLTFAIGYIDFDRRVLSFEESAEYIKDVANRDFALPMVYRILVPYTLYFIYKVSDVPMTYIYAFWRFLFYFLVFIFFHMYLRKWFDDKVAMIGTLSLIASLPLTMTNWYSIPTDMPELLTFILGAMWIRDNKYRNLLILIPLATLNRETSIALVMLYFLNGIGKEKPGALIRKTVACFTLWLIPYVTLMMIFGFKTWPPYANLIHNVQGLLAMFTHPNPYNHYYFILYLCGFYWVLAFLDFRKKDTFLKRSVIVMAIFFLYVFLRGGAINEIRIFTPFYVFVIPLGLLSLFKRSKNEVINSDTSS